MPKTLLCLLVLLLSGNVLAASGLEEGKPAPRLEGRFLDGTLFSLGNMQGKVVIVNFWATWCPPCREEMPVLDGLYRKYHGQGVEIIGVSVDGQEDEPKVKSAMQRYAYPSAVLDEVSTNEFGRIWRVPLIFVVDRQGILRRNAWQGGARIDARELENIVLPLLAKP